MKVDNNDILSEVYNIILNPATQPNEREILINFKSQVEKGKDFDDCLLKLAESLRELGVKNLSEKKKMSLEVNKFYMKISSHDLLKQNLGRGIAVSGFMF